MKSVCRIIFVFTDKYLLPRNALVLSKERRCCCVVQQEAKKYNGIMQDFGAESNKKKLPVLRRISRNGFK